ncbi:MAG: hypothetical protein JW873_04775 [Candidatus Saganbacteria bacterium]|nr:hypothetical protein [Candidatus Saganbacteria bacterium]
MKKNINLDTINIDILKSIKNEDLLRQKIIIPLLNYIFAEDVKDMHGSAEMGIDVWFENPDIFRHRKRFGVQVKCVDLVCKGKPDKNSNIITIQNQIKMAFSHSFNFGTSSKGSEGVHLDGFYIVTSGKVNKSAAEYIYSNKKEFSYIKIIDAEELMGIISNRETIKNANRTYEPSDVMRKWRAK